MLSKNFEWNIYISNIYPKLTENASVTKFSKQSGWSGAEGMATAFHACNANWKLEIPTDLDHRLTIPSGEEKIALKKNIWLLRYFIFSLKVIWLVSQCLYFTVKAPKWLDRSSNSWYTTSLFQTVMHLNSHRAYSSRAYGTKKRSFMRKRTSSEVNKIFLKSFPLQFKTSSKLSCKLCCQRFNSVYL